MLRLDAVEIHSCVHIQPDRPLEKMLLNRNHSLTRAFQFARVREQGVSLAGRFVVLSLLALDDPSEQSLFGIICTKKIGNAVLRNTLKRRIREIIRTHGDELAHGYYVVTILRWRSATAEYADVEKDWRRASRRLLNQIKGARA